MPSACKYFNTEATCVVIERISAWVNDLPAIDLLESSDLRSVNSQYYITTKEVLFS